jgi:hypothetical protein
MPGFSHPKASPLDKDAGQSGAFFIGRGDPDAHQSKAVLFRKEHRDQFLADSKI